MELSLDKNDLSEYISKQINNCFPDKYPVAGIDTAKILNRALERTEYSFSHIPLKYYCESGSVRFNHLNSEQYAMFLWFLSNEAYNIKNINLAEKIFYLNKMLNGLDAFYSIKLPDIFLFVHPAGAVIGNAHYENFLVVHQNCTIGASKEGIYPHLKKFTVLYASSSVIGKCNIGENTAFSAGTVVVNTDIPPNSIVFGQGRNLIIKQTKECLAGYNFKIN